MPEQSDWVKLAERLKCLPKNHKPGDTAFILIGNRWTPPSNRDAQDLLIGRALRVARLKYEDNRHVFTPQENTNIDQCVLSVFDDHAPETDLRAREALELLDAVGHEL